MTFSPDGRRIISAGGDKLIKVWDPEIGQETLTLRNHDDRVSASRSTPRAGAWPPEAGTRRSGSGRRRRNREAAVCERRAVE